MLPEWRESSEAGWKRILDGLERSLTDGGS
jgi:hypothetical protein